LFCSENHAVVIKARSLSQVNIALAFPDALFCQGNIVVVDRDTLICLRTLALFGEQCRCDMPLRSTPDPFSEEHCFFRETLPF
jgi:hypothetical protein